jgi:hypothetical protein
MHIGRRSILKIIAGAAATLSVRRARADKGGAIHRDVCILGGGGSGTYTAVRLRDLGKSVVVVESKNRLGGHCQTYHDPLTGGTSDVGVLLYYDFPEVRYFFDRFDVPLAPLPLDAVSNDYVDFRDGTRVAPLPPPSSIETYFDILNSPDYAPLDQGFYLSNNVLSQLAMPFEQFAIENKLQDMMHIAFQQGAGHGDFLNLPAVYVLKNFGLSELKVFFGLGGPHLSTGRLLCCSENSCQPLEGESCPVGTTLSLQTNNSEVYEKATDFLGDDVLFESAVTRVIRNGKRTIHLHVNTPYGKRIIHCQKLVVTFPPLLANFGAFDLDRKEQFLFSRFKANRFWAGVVRVSGFPDGLGVQNFTPPEDSANHTPYRLPPLPATYAMYGYSSPGLKQIFYGSTTPLTRRQVRANIIADIQRLSNTYPNIQLDPTEPIAFLTNHTPYELTVSSSDILHGFYADLYALQGRNNTFYTGAAFHAHSSSLIWRYTEALLPQIVASL